MDQFHRAQETNRNDLSAHNHQLNTSLRDLHERLSILSLPGPTWRMPAAMTQGNTRKC